MANVWFSRTCLHTCLCLFLCLCAAKNCNRVRKPAVEPAVNGRSTSVLCSISSQCVIARLDMCSLQITEKWLRLWQRETALTDWPWCSSTNNTSASFPPSPHPSAPFTYICRYDRAKEKDGQKAGESSLGWKLSGYIAIIKARLWLIDLTTLCRSLPHSTPSSFWDYWIMQTALRPHCYFIHIESYTY